MWRAGKRCGSSGAVWTVHHQVQQLKTAQQQAQQWVDLPLRRDIVPVGGEKPLKHCEVHAIVIKERPVDIEKEA